MRVLIAAEGTRGDVHPMLALTRHLIGAGHEVRLCAPPDFRDEVLETGAEFVALGVSVRDFVTQNADALHSRGPKMLLKMADWGEVSLESQFRVLPQAAQGVERIFAAGTILAAASAAELRGVPFRFIAYTPALMPSAHHTPALFPFQLQGARANRMLWRGALWLVNRIGRRDVNEKRAVLGLPPVGELVRHVLSPRPILATDGPLAPLPEDEDIGVEQIRCLHPHRPEPLPEKLEKFLAAGPPPVYFGFGSMTDPDPARTTDHLLALIDGLGCRALISRGWAGLADGGLPENVMAVGAVSHASLFPRSALVVHHGGSGTTHTAARAGVPQIIVPHVLDQFYFARRIEALGVGVQGPSRGRLRGERLAETLRACLDNEHLEARARALGEELAELGPTDPDLDRLLAA